MRPASFFRQPAAPIDRSTLTCDFQQGCGLRLAPCALRDPVTSPQLLQ
jgi:hypothetical protein